MSKKINITNSGQFAGNIDSPGAIVNVSQDMEAQLGSHVDDAEVQEHLRSDAPEAVKTSAIAKRLSQISGVALDVATTFAAKLVRQEIGGLP